MPQQTLKVLDQSQKNETFPYMIKKCGMEITVYQNVFSPKYFPDSEWAAIAILNQFDVTGKRILEIGAGTGLVACALAKNGANLTATDINPFAIENIKFNANHNHLAIDVRAGDLFNPVKGEQFDIIFWNIPFSKNEFSTSNIDEILLKACFSPDYTNFWNFIRDGFDYLAPNGHLLMGYSPGIGTDEELDKIITDLNLTKMVLSDDCLNFDNTDQYIQLLEFQKK